MANFNLSTIKASGKDFISNAKTPAVMGGLIAGGAIASQKVLSFKTWMPNADPNAFYIKHEGGVKAVAGIATLAMWKGAPDWAKWLIMGVIVQGAIQEARVLSNNNLPQIGETDDEIMQQAASELLDGKMNGRITDEYNSMVAGMGANDDDDDNDDITQQYPTMVAGMGVAWGNNW